MSATRQSIEATIRLISSKKNDPYAILSGTDGLTFMQTLVTPGGFCMEYQAGSLERHYETIRSDFSAEEVIEAFCDFAEGNTTWQHRFDFCTQEVRSPYYRVGHAVGSIAGRVVRLFSKQ